MALFQPTNIIPSSLIGQGTVDVNDNMEISWQVNGNSAMTAFQIDFYQNDTASTYVASTGKITNGIPTGGFYGTDRFGNPQFFTYSPNPTQTWKAFNSAFTNGNEYKFKIIQWFKATNSVVSCQPSSAPTSGTQYYFTVNNGTYQGAVVSFTAPSNIAAGATFYYSFTNGECWVESGNRTIVLNGNMNVNGNVPDGATELLGNKQTDTLNYMFVAQNSASIIITRTTPTLTINQTNENYLNPTVLPTTLATSIGYFQATYQQDQDDPIRWIRWQVAQANNGVAVAGEILADTGDIYTPTLNFEFNGFFNGQQYAIRCFGESESGQPCNSNPSNEGWVFFNIEIVNSSTYTGTFTASCLDNENTVLLQWEGVNVVSPTVSPIDYTPTLANGSISLFPKNADTGEEYSVTWNNKGKSSSGAIIPLSFTPSWVTALKFALFLPFKTSDITFSGTTETKNAYQTLSVSGQASVIGSKGYKYEVTYSFQTGMAKIADINISGGNASSYEYSVDEQNRKFTITLYRLTSGIVYTNVSVKYEYYSLESQEIAPAKINAYTVPTVSDDILSYNISYNNNVISAIIYCKNENTNISLIVKVSYEYMALGKLFEAKDNTGNKIVLSVEDNLLIVDFNENNLLSISPPNNADAVAILTTPTTIHAYFYSNNQLLEQSSNSIALLDWQFTISAVSIYGGDNGVTIDSVSVFQGDGSNILSFYQNPDFEPAWDTNNYSLYMTANFNGNLEGGTGTATGSGFRIYRQEVGNAVLLPVATVPATVTSLKDYGIVSRKAYKYSLYAYDDNDAFMSAVEAESTIATNFKNYSLLVCDYDQTNDEYHVHKQYLFALNLTDGSVSNNNSPALNANFTQYPTRMPSTQNYASGTLSGLIGAIYTVPALIEQIGQYKYTAKPSTLDYFDSVDLEQELYDLSVAPYQLFLRDMKGRLRMIATSAPITMTTNLKQRQQSISISLPWVEVGDASDVTIIQTPDDYGWNNDNQVLDVQLNVDVATGELSAQYPFPYNGTKFYLTGANKETLTANTPLGITPAQFELSDIAEQPNDGKLTATVTVSSEDNQ